VSNTFYVGKSWDIEKRLMEHALKGNGAAAFAKQMGKTSRIDTLTEGSDEDLESWERNETLHLMRIHGIQNVRGWMFTCIVMSEPQKQTAFQQICEKFDLCRRCGRSTHFVDRCNAQTMDEWTY
jgi:hypothetical protein